MKTLVILDHPYGAQASENEPHNRSFCAALCKRLRISEEENGRKVDLIDLAADDFNPVMSRDDLVNWRQGVPMNPQVADYQRRMKEADRIVLIFPLWWELMPARMKGFIDKVYAKNILYTQNGNGKLGTSTLKKNAEVIAVTPMGTPTILYKLAFGKPVVKALKWGLCRKTGIRSFRWIPVSGVDKLPLEKRIELLDGFSL